MNVEFTQLVIIGNQGILKTTALNANEKYYYELKNLLKIKRLKKSFFTRIGRAYDGGYIMIDDFQKSTGGGTLILLEFLTMFLGIMIWSSAVTKFLCTI